MLIDDEDLIVSDDVVLVFFKYSLCFEGVFDVVEIVV